MEQKTIFITISIGIIARNLLRTDFFKILKEQKNLRIVLIMPPNVDEYLKKELLADNVVIEGWRGRVRAGVFRHFLLYPFMAHLVFTESTKMFLRYGKVRQPKNTPFRYWFGVMFFWPLSKIKFLKNFTRWIDLKFFSRYDQDYEELFKKYNPCLVFATNLTIDPIDKALLRIAKKQDIKTIGMAKSWDNLDKYLITVLPDIFLVWNEKMKNDLIKLQNMPAEKIILTGIPQFDIYKNSSIFWTREEYCARFNIDPAKKILFFGSGFANAFDEELVTILRTFIENKELVKDCVLLLRPHFRDWQLKDGWFWEMKGKPGIILDFQDRLAKCFSDLWDPSYDDMIRLANHFYHCDVLITTQSTLSLDGIVFSKPVINIAFDGFFERPKFLRSKKWFSLSHYQPIVKSKAVFIAENIEMLRKIINDCLENPTLKKTEQESFTQEFCFRFDGHSSQRIAEAALGQIGFK